METSSHIDGLDRIDHGKQGLDRSFGFVFAFVFLVIALWPLLNAETIYWWALITAALDVFGDRPAALANDLTKMYEQVGRAPLSVLLEQLITKRPRGEYILVSEGNMEVG